MQTLKKYVRSSSNPIVQVATRQRELNSIGINEGPKVVKYAISLNFKDSFYIDSKGKYVLLKSKIGTTRYVCKIIKDIYLEDFFKKPVNSNVFSIVYVRIFQEKIFDCAEIDGSNLATKLWRCRIRQGICYFHYFINIEPSSSM